MSIPFIYFIIELLINVWYNISIINYGVTVSMQKILAVVGPTASGKTTLAIELAKNFNGEIISCDSMQIYRNMDIGTAKPTIAEMNGIPHHLIDIIEPYDNFSCSDYVVAAKDCIDYIKSRNKLPIFCGGTGLYLDSVLTDNKFAEHRNPTDTAIRDRLMNESSEKLHERLQTIDPESANTIHPNNIKRVVRALEIYYMTGKTKTQWDKESRSKNTIYNPIIIGLDYKNRDLLYDKINRRVDMMIAAGLVEEVKSLDIDLLSNSTAGQAIGYKEVIEYIRNECTFDEMIDKIKLNTRRYAKRQLTWFKRNKDIRWFYSEYYDNDTTKYKEIVNNLFMLLT